MDPDRLMSVGQAADMLDVSTEAVRKMIRTGRLPVAVMVGKRVRVDRAAVHRLAAAPTRTGRIWSPRMAWGAISILEGREDLRLHPFAASRIESSLSSITPVEFHQLARARATVQRFEWDANVVPHVRASSEPSGVSVPEEKGLSKSLGVNLASLDEGSEAYEGYIYPGAMTMLCSLCNLQPSRTGGITLRVIDFPRTHARSQKPFVGSVPDVAIALDLMDLVDTRQYEAGKTFLQRSLEGFQSSTE